MVYAAMDETENLQLTPKASDYEIMSDLGQSTGIFGIVAMVRHSPTNTLLAAKRYELDRLTSEEEDLIRFEVCMAKQLKHPNVLPCVASFVWDQSVCILSPLMDLGSCNDLITNYFPSGIPELAVAFILREALHGLDYIHHQGIILRSIRASHLFVCQRGRVRIGGLRYACSIIKGGKWLKCLHDFPSSTLPNLNWLSPEILEQDMMGYNSKSDVFSLGITTCEMANGIVPFADMEPLLMLTEKIGGRCPQLLDKYAVPYLTETSSQQPDSGVGTSAEMSEAEEAALSAVEKREFSENFHHFVEICLSRASNVRPSPARLLNHTFFKQCRKGSLAAVLSPYLANQACAAINHDMLTDMTAERISDLQLDSVQWNF
ncbi:STE20-related kinase adapter protein alpha [Cloeon dipterum]|uniref:STE20-related kinase adapter protein alpha n=1 Tax=Cloeon dipterum TaxID=197152 RepID=UPI00321FC795